jgi:hypothetical protein
MEHWVGIAALLATYSGGGYCWLRRLPVRWYRPELAVAALVVGILTGTWAAFLCSWGLGYRWGLPLAWGVGLAWLIFQYRATCLRRAPASKPMTVSPSTPGPTLSIPPRPATLTTAKPREEAFLDLPRPAKWGWGVYAVGTGVAIAALLSHHYLSPGPEGWYSTGGSWGDLPMHVSLLRNFAAAEQPELTYPLLVHTKLTYPFLSNFLSALGERGGLSVRLSLIFPSWLVWWSTLQLLYFLAGRLAGRGRLTTGGMLPAALAATVWMANGSFSGLVLAWQEWRQSEVALTDFLRHLPRDYTHVPESGLALINLTTSHLLPQRGIAFGLATLALIWLLTYLAWENDAVPKEADQGRHRQPAGRQLMLTVAVLAGLLPFFHFHSFLTAAWCVTWLAGWRWWSRYPDRRAWALSVLLIGLIALPQVFWQWGANHSSPYAGDAFFFWHWGWLTEPGGNPVLFWLRNAGFFLALAAFAIKGCPDWRSGSWPRLIFFPLAVLFLAINVLSFQPNPFDNYKLLVPVWLLVTLLGTVALLDWASRASWRPLIAAILLLLVTLPGGLALAQAGQNRWLLVDHDGRRFAERVQQFVPPDQRILTTGEHNNPVSMLSGRPVVRGYPGWLWTYGWNIYPLDQDIYSIWLGTGDVAALLRRHGIAYIAVREAYAGQALSYREPADPDWQALAGKYPVVAREGGWLLFAVPPIP